MGFGISGSGFQDPSSGFQDREFQISGIPGFRSSGFQQFRVPGVPSFGCRVQGAGAHHLGVVPPRVLSRSCVGVSGLWKVYRGCMEGVRRVHVKCVEGVWGGGGRCVEGVRRVHGGSVEGLRGCRASDWGFTGIPRS